MEQTAIYECPNCGAGLTFDAGKQMFACEFCLSEFTRDQVLAANSDEARREREAEEASYNAQMNEYECQSCGAHVVADENTVASTCAYCHNPVVLVGRLSGEMKPQKIIPFHYDRDTAKSGFLGFVRKKWFVPKSFFTPEQVEMIQGIYYPFWVTDLDADSSLDAHGQNIRRWRSGNREYREVTHFNIHRQGTIHFEDLTTAALSDEDKRMLEGILPFPSKALEDFSMPYLSGYTAKKRNLSQNDIKGEIKNRITGYSRQILRNTIRNYDSIQFLNSSCRVLRSHWDYSLLPVWVLTYRANSGRIYTYTMNGYTGKVHGELPVSKLKLGLFAGFLFAALTALLTLLGGAML